LHQHPSLCFITTTSVSLRPVHSILSIWALLGGLDKTLLSFLKIDDVPDGVEILARVNDVASITAGG